MPSVRECIKDETGLEPSSEVHPDEAVAIGAAYHALDVLKESKKKARQSGDTSDEVFNVSIPEMSRQYTFKDVTSHGVGLVIQNEYGEEENSVILPKNVQVPVEHTNCYSTTVPYQERLLIRVTQGEESDLRYVTVIGTAEIQVSPREKLVGIEVTISCDENSIIHVRVYDQDLKQDLGEMHIDRVYNLSDDEVKQNQMRISKLDISGD